MVLKHPSPCDISFFPGSVAYPNMGSVSNVETSLYSFIFMKCIAKWTSTIYIFFKSYFWDCSILQLFSYLTYHVIESQGARSYRNKPLRVWFIWRHVIDTLWTRGLTVACNCMQWCAALLCYRLVKLTRNDWSGIDPRIGHSLVLGLDNGQTWDTTATLEPAVSYSSVHTLI